MGALQAAGERASAQTASDPDAFLMRPALDGNPQDPPRFRPARSAAQQGGSSRFGELPNFSYRPALGAGTTGFDSSSARKRKGKLGQKPKPAGPPILLRRSPAARKRSRAPLRSPTPRHRR